MSGNATHNSTFNPFATFNSVALGSAPYCSGFGIVAQTLLNLASGVKIIYSR